MNRLSMLETPSYSIDVDELDYNYNSLQSAFKEYWKGKLIIGYSYKTNHLSWILNYMKDKGAYAEVVSADEYRLAELLGYDPTKIILNGPYKSRETLLYALENKSIVNLENFTELSMLNSFRNNKEVKIGLRVNFNLDNECPFESAMGEEPSRFGFCLENGDFEKALIVCQGLNIQVCGIQMHQSTKTRSVKVYQSLAEKAVECINKYDLQKSLEYIDIGGGFFGGKSVKNKPSYKDYAQAICEILKREVNMHKVTLIIEPGASLVSTPISYYTKVVDVKDVRGTRIVTVDGSILHINPFLSNRKHEYSVNSREKAYPAKQIVCGSTCMENDRLLIMENEPQLKLGDTIEIKKCGSYTMTYNSCFISLPPTVYIKKYGNYKVVRNKWLPKVLVNSEVEIEVETGI